MWRRAVKVIVVVWVAAPIWISGGLTMSEAQQISQAAAKLRAELDSYHVSLLALESGFKGYSDAVKNELVESLARVKEPLPPGKLLARLPFIRTTQNEASMQTVFINNLRSPHTDARTSSLYGLQQLNHPRLADFAEQALNDDSDDVLVAACAILIPKANQDARLRSRLQLLYSQKKDKPEFYTTIELLKAHRMY